MKTQISKKYTFTRGEVRSIMLAHIKSVEADDANAGFIISGANMDMEGTSVPDDKEALWLNVSLAPVPEATKQ